MISTCAKDKKLLARKGTELDDEINKVRLWHGELRQKWDMTQFELMDSKEQRRIISSKRKYISQERQEKIKWLKMKVTELELELIHTENNYHMELMRSGVEESQPKAYVLEPKTGKFHDSESNIWELVRKRSAMIMNRLEQTEYGNLIAYSKVENCEGIPLNKKVVNIEQLEKVAYDYDGDEKSGTRSWYDAKMRSCMHMVTKFYQLNFIIEESLLRFNAIKFFWENSTMLNSIILKIMFSFSELFCFTSKCQDSDIVRPHDKKNYQVNVIHERLKGLYGLIEVCWNYIKHESPVTANENKKEAIDHLEETIKRANMMIKEKKDDVSSLILKLANELKRLRTAVQDRWNPDILFKDYMNVTVVTRVFVEGQSWCLVKWSPVDEQNLQHSEKKIKWFWTMQDTFLTKLGIAIEDYNFPPCLDTSELKWKDSELKSLIQQKQLVDKEVMGPFGSKIHKYMASDMNSGDFLSAIAEAFYCSLAKIQEMKAALAGSDKHLKE